MLPKVIGKCRIGGKLNNGERLAVVVGVIAKYEGIQHNIEVDLTTAD